MRALRLGMIVGPAVLLAALGVTHPLEWAARVAVYGYAACYTALDLLAGWPRARWCGASPGRV